MPDDEELLTSPQTAVRLAVSTRTVHRLAVRGDLPIAHRLPGPNGAFLFRATDVDKFAAPRAAA